MDYKEDFKELFSNDIMKTSELDYFFDKSNIKYDSHSYKLFKSLIKIVYGNGVIDGIKANGGNL